MMLIQVRPEWPSIPEIIFVAEDSKQAECLTSRGQQQGATRMRCCSIARLVLFLSASKELV